MGTAHKTFHEVTALGGVAIAGVSWMKEQYPDAVQQICGLAVVHPFTPPVQVCHELIGAGPGWLGFPLNTWILIGGIIAILMLLEAICVPPATLILVKLQGYSWTTGHGQKVQTLLRSPLHGWTYGFRRRCMHRGTPSAMNVGSDDRQDEHEPLL